MPLHGKIVVIKRSGGDGTEFPLTATCLFGRKPDCDIRIQLPQVSKEHCRIDLNENKEVVLTNLSSVNPTRVNGDVLQQSERLKHGDVITVIDRSFRFEYPPAPTPKKRSSTGGKTEPLKVLQDQQVVDTVETGEKRISEVFTDGTNHENIQRSLEKTVEVESKESDGALQNKTSSPFNDLYQMIKKSLDVKTPGKSSISLLQTPASRMCTPKPGSVRSKSGIFAIATEDRGTPKKDEAGVDDTMKEVEDVTPETPKSVKKHRKSMQLSSENLKPAVKEDETKPEATTPQKRNRASPQRFTAGEVIELVSAQTPKSPMRRRSKEATPTTEAVTKEREQEAPNTENLRRVSPRNAGKAMSKKRKSEELAADLPTQQMKRKRVSFGGFLTPELFDKRLPPNSPLQKGAAPRRSLSLYKPKESLLRRASAIGLLKEDGPKAKSPAKKKSPSPKKSPKTPTPGKKSPKSRSPSPKAASPAKKVPKSTVKTPVSSGDLTPAVQGRFSVSRISTPSPVAEDVVPDPMPSVSLTPKIPLRRKSITRRTPCVTKSAAKVMRRSSVSRASMRVNSWADKVKFGQPKAQVAAPTIIVMTKNPTKKAVPKPQTPARKLMSDIGTGHANSPVTIVVGRAHQRKVVQPSGAAPRVIPNISLSKKNMKMDEDLTGICDIFKTPANERKRICVFNDNSATETPMGVLGTSVVEPSVLNTPEETGEMIVSPLNLASTVKGRRYNGEAVQRLLNSDEESSFISEVPALEIPSESIEQPCVAVKSTAVRTPKQKPEQQCLTEVKPLMKTPKQKAEPIDDLRGKILKTPKQKVEHKECLTGVKRIMKTPRQKAEPVEDIRGNLLVTPKQRPEHQECITGVKKMFQTPQKEVESLEDLLVTPEAPVVADVCVAAAVVLQEMPAPIKESEDLSKTRDATPPNVQSSPERCIQRTWEEERAPIEEEPEETDQAEDPMPPDSGLPASNDVAFEEPQAETPSQQIDDDLQVDIAKESDEVVHHTEEIPAEQDNDESSDAMDTISQTTVDNSLALEHPKVDAADENLSGEPSEATEIDIPTVDPVHVKKSVRGRRAKAAEMKPAEDKQEAPEQSEDAVAPAPVRERRGKKSEVTAPSTARQTTRSRNAKATVSRDADLTVEESAPQPSKVAVKPKRGRKPKQVSDDEAGVVQEAEEPAVAAEEPASAAEEPAVAAEEPASAAEEPAVAAEEPAVEAEEPSVVAEELPVVATEPAVEPVAESVQIPFADDQPAPQEKAAVQKKSVRGRRVKIAETKAAAEDKQEAKDQSEEPVVAAPVRGRRGKKTEAAAPPTVRHATRTRNAKSQENTVDDKPENVPEEFVETKPLPDISPEAESDYAAPVNPSPEVNQSAPPVEEPAVKTLRGRKRKPTPAEPPQPEENEVVHDEKLVADPQQPISTIGKPKRGRQKKPDTTEQTAVTEDTAVTGEAVQQPPVRARRGRNAKQEEEKKENDSQPIVAEIKNAQEPAKKLRRTRKTEQDDLQPREEEIQTTEAVVPEEAVVQPQETSEQVTVTAKPRRGGRKPKQPAESEIPESTLVPEAPAVKSTDKPKRSRRGKEVTQEEAVAVQVPEEESEAEVKETAEPDAPAIKPSRGRAAKTSVKNELPAKRARRGAAPLPEDAVSESTSAEPTKRGRRPKPTAEEPAADSAPAEPSDAHSADVDDPTASKRAVRWKDNLEVSEIPKATPVKAVRGRKAKLVELAEAESKNDANKPEEKDLSDEVAEAQPAKRARRGAKVVEEAESSSTVDQSKGAEAETQPKKRRGRPAKK